MLSDEDCDEILSNFPEVQFAFSYGSGAIEQGGYDYEVTKAPAAIGAKKKNGEQGEASSSSAALPMVDFVFAVDDPDKWHAQNIQENPDHYTTIVPMNSKTVSLLQDNFGASIWYNTTVKMECEKYPDRMMKYGVISKDYLMQDLLSWSDLYCSGRLHKPVRIIRSTPEIDAAITANMEQAVAASLLILPSVFREEDIYLTIAQLSYVGDPRMLMSAENPKKVANLVNPTLSMYRRMYAHAVSRVGSLTHLKRMSNPPGIRGGNVWYSQRVSNDVRDQLSTTLPRTVRTLLSFGGLSVRSRGIRFVLAAIVARSSSIQSFKGVATSGIIKCTHYLTSKFDKYFGKAASRSTTHLA